MTGFILAGGKSSRMNEDKGLKQLAGKPIVQYVIDALKPCVEEVIIISNNFAYHQFGCKVVADLVSDAGPLGGILTGLSNSVTDFNFFISCDMPFINSEAIGYLAKLVNGNKIIVPTVRGEIQPLFGIYPLSCLASVKTSIQENKLKLISFVEEYHHVLVPMEESGLNMNSLFTNINTQEDFTTAARFFNNEDDTTNSSFAPMAN